MSTPFDRIVSDCLEDVDWNLRSLDHPDVAAWFGRTLESPIELLFAQAFLARVFTSLEHELIPIGGNIVEGATRRRMAVSLQAQVSVENNRVDFVLTLAKRVSADAVKTTKVAIECDGYAFHHGNPERAARDKARDRELAPHFDALLRFTGAEIHASAYSCVCQALRVAGAKLS